MFGIVGFSIPYISCVRVFFVACVRGCLVNLGLKSLYSTFLAPRMYLCVSIMMQFRYFIFLYHSPALCGEGFSCYFFEEKKLLGLFTEKNFCIPCSLRTINFSV